MIIPECDRDVLLDGHITAITAILRSDGATAAVAAFGSWRIPGVAAPNDPDFIAYTPDLSGAIRRMIGVGYAPDLDGVYEDTSWVSVRRGPVNVVLTCSHDRFLNTARAQRVCEYLRIVDREERIRVFHIIRGDYDLDLPTRP